MRVLCIDNKPRPYSKNIEILNLIKEGNEYEVYRDGTGMGVDGTIEAVYYLVGINQRPKGLAASRFILLSGIDETELVKERDAIEVTELDIK